MTETSSAIGTPVKIICCDNSGEKKGLMNKCRESQDLTDVEFTTRDSTQYNAKVERKLAVLWRKDESIV
jgi:hypothetical protein